MTEPETFTVAPTILVHVEDPEALREWAVGRVRADGEGAPSRVPRAALAALVERVRRDTVTALGEGCDLLAPFEGVPGSGPSSSTPCSTSTARTARTTRTPHPTSLPCTRGAAATGTGATGARPAGS